MKPLSASLPTILQTVATVTKPQIAAIQTLRRKAGLTEADYRAMLMAVGGVQSTTQLTMARAELLRSKLQAMAPAQEAARPQGKRTAKDTMSGPYAGVLRALWLSAYNLGIVQNRDDRALIAFVERQTKISHPGFLHSGKDAQKAIEALKAMITREGGVHWPRRSDVPATKRAIIDAQILMLDQMGGMPLRQRLPRAENLDQELDQVQASLGVAIRAAKAAR
jgi:Protein of unknown function (DUF1018)